MADCWRDSRARWYQGGIHHEGSKHDCACPCHCSAVFEKVAHRLKKDEYHSTDHSVDLSRIIEGDDDELNISPIIVKRRTPTTQDESKCLCEYCCTCEQLSDDAETLRLHSIPQISLFYSPPTFLQDLCGVTAFASSTHCRRVNEDECMCHGLWVDFFSEIMNAYAERYTDSVNSEWFE